MPEAAPAVETLPGALDGAWPITPARVADGWVLPWRDDAGVHVRRVLDDGARDDRFVDGGALVGVAPLSTGFAVVVTDRVELRAHFVAADGERVVRLPLDGNPAPSVASDGARLLVAVTRGGEIAIEQPLPLTATLLLVDGDGARAIDLGAVAAIPSLTGDARGFVVGGTRLVDGAGALVPAPGRQIRDARLFRQSIAAGTLPTSDRVTLDGSAWLDAGGLVGFAARDGGVVRLEVVTDGGRALREVGDDLTPLATWPLPSTTRGDGGQSWLAAAAAGRALWAATVENDPVFAILQEPRMRADRAVIRIRAATSRTIVASAGPSGVLLTWIEGRSTVRYAVVAW